MGTTFTLPISNSAGQTSSSYIRIFNWKVGRSHDLRDDTFHEFIVERASMHPELGMPGIERFEIGKPHNMVPVGVSKKEMILISFFVSQKIAKPPNSCAGINDNDIIALCPDFQASCISTIFKIFFSRNRNGTP